MNAYAVSFRVELGGREQRWATAVQADFPDDAAAVARAEFDAEPAFREVRLSGIDLLRTAEELEWARAVTSKRGAAVPKPDRVFNPR